MQLEIAGQAVVKNLNLRREYHGEDRELGCDLKLQLHVDLEALASFSPALKSLLYTDADDKEKRALRMPDLKPLGLVTEFENHTLHLADRSYDGVTVGKFAIDAEQDGGVKVTMTVSMSKIKASVAAELAVAFVDEVVNIDIEPQQLSLIERAA